MAYLLAIETATTVCSVALFQDQKLLACREESGSYSHSENLAIFIDEILKESSLTYEQLNAVLISKGPGSYTGLRIGISLAKGLCFSLQIPLISVDTLKSMAWGANQLLKKRGEYLLCSMIDARRMEVYSAFFTQQLKSIRSTTADIIESNSYSELLNNSPIYFFGDGAKKCKETIVHENAHFLIDQEPSATFMGALGYEKYQAKRFEDLAYFEPFYLKEFIALKGKALV